MVDRVIDAVIAVIPMALFNALVRPVILALAAPISLILVAVSSSFSRSSRSSSSRSSPGVDVEGFGTALIASFVYAIINTILTRSWASTAGPYYGRLVRAC